MRRIPIKLSMPKEVIQAIKHYCIDKDISVSRLTERFYCDVLGLKKENKKGEKNEK